MVFQFTHPGKGATRKKERGYIRPDVSIHAPWEGCDVIECEDEMYQLKFQFTHPGKGATQRLASLINANGVSIHAPWEGCDREELIRVEVANIVSIHAPWEGCDV